MVRTACAALLALATPAAAQVASFPCEQLGDSGTRVFDAVGPAAAPRSSAPVRLRKNALLARERFPLEAASFTFDDAALATDGGTLPALSFGAYRIGGALRFCSQESRDGVFGPRNRDGMYMMRCLVDSDGDGRFEGFRAHGELVPISRSGKTGAPTGIVPPLHPLPRPVALVRSAAAPDAQLRDAPRLVVETRVSGLTATAATVRTRAQVMIYPGQSDERIGADYESVAAIPLREGRFELGFGRTILLARNGKSWQALLGGSTSAPAELQCGGSVVAVGSTFTILRDGGMSVLSRRPLP